MPIEQDPKDSEMSYTNYGFTPDEGQELQAQLEPGEWQALLAVQQMLNASPTMSPDAGFSNRVLTRLATRERARAQRRNALGVLAFGLGSLLLTAFLLWSSPLGALTETSTWVGLLNGIAAAVPALTTVFVVIRTFATAFWQSVGTVPLVLVALLTFGLTAIWTRIVAQPAFSNRPIRATEAY